MYNTQQKNGASKPSCVYCDATGHKSFNCTKVVNLAERRSILLQKRLCFNCTGPHKAENCCSKMTCQKCNKKHHTTICNSDQSTQRSKGLLTAHQRDKLEVVYPVVLVNVNGIKTRALLDTGAESSYASAQLINALHIKPAEIQTKRIEMMLGSMTTKVEMYDVNMTSVSGDFSMGVTVSKVDKPELMTLENPKYEELMKRYTHVHGVYMDDKDTKPQLPIHLVLGAYEYARIKTSTSAKIALSGQPVEKPIRENNTWLDNNVTRSLERNQYYPPHPGNQRGFRTALSFRHSWPCRLFNQRPGCGLLRVQRTVDLSSGRTL